MRMALYQPDIPQNAGAIMRTAACLGVPLDLIGPCGFVLSDRRLRRAGMDYLERLQMAEHDSWAGFLAARETMGRPNGAAGESNGAADGQCRLVLLTTAGETAHLDFRFRPADVLVVGSESAGVPAAVAAACDARVRVPIQPGARSLNVAQALAIVLGEALRQTDGFPGGFAEPAP